jgi:glycosyltransferase involved in cell wall biosynthesis
MQRRGIQVRVLTTDDMANDRGHYTALLRGAQVPLRQASASVLTAKAAGTVPWHLLRSAPHTLWQSVVDLASELAVDPPDVLHCWLDDPNAIGALAGLMADVPCIILSTRNANPTNFPRFYAPYLRDCYWLASLSRRIHFLANSHSGAASYADWIGVPVERFQVIFNGIDRSHFPAPSPKSRAQARAVFNRKDSDRVVSGVFRLAEEKQPELFLEVIRHVRAKVPNLHVLMAGNGDLDDRVAQIVRDQGMTGYVSLLGRRTDVRTILLASDATLLTSKVEGCPNIALEAQLLGTPIVATAGGGTVDAVVHGTTGFLAGIHDAPRLAEYLTLVLTDPQLHRRLASAGPGFITERFGLDTMSNDTLTVYHQALGLAPAGAPPKATPIDEAPSKVA